MDPVLAHYSKLGISFSIADGRLIMSAPETCITDDLKQEIRNQKTVIIHALSQTPVFMTRLAKANPGEQYNESYPHDPLRPDDPMAVIKSTQTVSELKKVLSEMTSKKQSIDQRSRLHSVAIEQAKGLIQSEGKPHYETLEEVSLICWNGKE